jgi:hypothetical protein
MELPAEILIHNEVLGMKGKAATLLGIHTEGYYEVVISFGESDHRVLLPIDQTVLIAEAAEETWADGREEIEY